MKDFYIRNVRVWVKVMRKSDKSFVFVTGYTDNMVGFKTLMYSKEYMPTIADAKAHAEIIAADYQ